MLRCLFTVRQHEIAVQHRLPFATPYCTTQNQLPRDWLDVVGRSTTYGFCTILDMCHVSRFPVHDHMSLPLHQYSYCADLILARMFALSDFEFWLTFTRSFKNLQARSITCVPAFVLIFRPLGNLCVFMVTYFGSFQTHLPLIFTFFFWWTTASCKTPEILDL